MSKNGKTWKIAGVLAGIFITAATVVYAYGVLNAEVDQCQETDVKQDIKIEKNEEDIDECEKCIIKQTTHYEHILKAIEKIEKKLP